MKILSIHNLSKKFIERQILENISFQINVGDKIGIIGQNGCGKTTLFKIIQGIDKQDKGNLSLKKDITIGYIEQEPSTDLQQTVNEFIKEGFKELNLILNKIETLEKNLTNNKNMHLYSKLNEEFESKNGYLMDTKFNIVTKGLGLDQDFLNKGFSKLSGGEKTKAQLAQQLLKEPDLLLLDEPTNHMDLFTIEWLEDYLCNSFKGAALIISHDKTFLNNTVNKIIEIEYGISYEYHGNYSIFEKLKKEKEEKQLHDYITQKNQIKKMQEAAKRFRDWASKGDNEKFYKKAKSLEKKIEEMEKIKKPISDKEKKLSIEFNEKTRSGKDVVVAKNMHKSFGNRNIFKDTNFIFNYKDRIGLIGKNGSGKTTLIKMLLGKETVSQGELILGTNLKVGYLPQSVDFSNIKKTIIDYFTEETLINEKEARNILAYYGFKGDDVFNQISGLSGGERVRIKLITMMNSNINFLILDEPTNHLDIYMIDSLIEALKNYFGTLLIISHDRYFINKTTEKLFFIDNHEIKQFKGTLKELKNNIVNKVKTNEKADNVIKKKSKQKVINKKKNKNKFTINNLENKIIEIENEISKINIEIEQNSFDYEKLQELSNIKNNLEIEFNTIIDKLDNLV